MHNAEGGSVEPGGCLALGRTAPDALAQGVREVRKRPRPPPVPWHSSPTAVRRVDRCLLRLNGWLLMSKCFLRDRPTTHPPSNCPPLALALITFAPHALSPRTF